MKQLYDIETFNFTFSLAKQNFSKEFLFFQVHRQQYGIHILYSSHMYQQICKMKSAYIASKQTTYEQH